MRLRANGQSKIEKTLQVPQVEELVTAMSQITKRVGFAMRLRQGGIKPKILEDIGRKSDCRIEHTVAVDFMGCYKRERSKLNKLLLSRENLVRHVLPNLIDVVLLNYFLTL